MPRVLYVGDKSAGYTSTASYEYVGRRVGSKWGNPFIIGTLSRDEVVMLYAWRLWETGLIWSVGELRGKDLGCHCGPRQRCHARDVLLPLANSCHAW